MTTTTKQKKMPDFKNLYADDLQTGNMGNWKQRHNVAVATALQHGTKPGMAIVRLIASLMEYANGHHIRYESPIGDDYVLCKGVAEIASGLRILLNGETGDLDCGTLDGVLCQIIEHCGVEA